MEETPKNNLSTRFHPDISDTDSLMHFNQDASLGKRAIHQISNLAEPPSPQSGRSNANLLTLSNPNKMIKIGPQSPNISMSSPMVTFDQNGNYDEKYLRDNDQISEKSNFEDMIDNIDNRSQEGFTALEDFINKKEDDFTLNDY